MTPRIDDRRELSGFSMLEAVVVVGVLLALAVGGFLAYGQITTNAKIAKVKSSASEVYTAAMVNQIDGNPKTSAEEVITRYNESNDKIKVDIRPGESETTLAAMTTALKAPIVGEEFCVTATMINEPEIFAEIGVCSPMNESPEGNPVEPGEVEAQPLPESEIKIDPEAIMITTWNIEKDSCKQINLPISGDFIGNVKWGEDANPVNNLSGLKSPILSSETGLIEVTVNGDFILWGGRTNWTDNDCLVSVNRWGETGTTSLTHAFHNADNLKHVERIPSTTSTLGSAFHDVGSDFTLGGFDTSNVKDITNVFRGASNFNQNINNWNTKAVTTTLNAFRDAANFNQPLDKWNVSSVTEMRWMFDGTSAFNQNLSAWDTSSVKSMAFMFGDAFTMKNGVKHNTYTTTTTLTYKCDSLTSGYLPIASTAPTYSWSDRTSTKAAESKKLDGGREYIAIIEGEYAIFGSYVSLNPCLKSVDHWGVDTGVTNASNSFKDASKLTNLPSSIPNTINNMSGMFYGAILLNDPDINNWDTSNVTNMISAFRGATNFNQNINNWDTNSVTNMLYMFRDATSFNQPLNKWNVSKVTEMRWTFDGANSFNQDLSTWDTSSVKSMAFMFGDAFTMKNGIKHKTFNTTTTLTYKCDILTAGYLPIASTAPTYSWSDRTSTQAMESKKLDAGREYIVVIEGKYSAFGSYVSLSPCLRSVDHWGIDTEITNAANAFKDASNLINVPSSAPSTINNMSGMFYEATSFNDPDINNWDTSNVTNMNSAFRNAKDFNQNINNWDTSNVTNMLYMFRGTTSFNQPINKWNVSKVTEMRWMFEGANAFNQDLSAWDTSSVKSMAFMFGDTVTMKNGVKHKTLNTTTALTYKCDVKTEGYLPITSTDPIYSWSETVATRSGKIYTLEAGREYTIVIEGKYSAFGTYVSLNPCLRSVDHWGSDTGVTVANNAFKGAINLTSITDNIPNTITVMNYMFNGAIKFNQNLNHWDVSKVTSHTDFAKNSALTQENLPTFN
jgi:surface protein